MYPKWRPFFREDRDVDDYTSYGLWGPIRFNPELESSVEHILQAIRDRGGVIHLAFLRRRLFTKFDATCISLMQDGDPRYHVELWFGENVTNMVVNSEGVFLSSLPREEGVWELVRLPVTDVGLAFRLGVDIVRKCNRAKVHYDDHFWQNLEGGVCRACFRGDFWDRWVCGDDYDEERPETWRGVHCSQLVALFLKRCVRRGVLPLPAGDREFLLGTYTPTCLPRQLMDLALRLWPGPVEVRDMGHIPQDLRLWWFGHDGLPPPEL